MTPKQGDISMKGNIIFGAAIAVGAALTFSAPSAYASCQAICASEYRLCIADGHPEATCSAELSACFDECTGGSKVSAAERTKLHIKDQNGQDIALGQNRPSTLLPKEAKT
jgi:hypothetical protein